MAEQDQERIRLYFTAPMDAGDVHYDGQQWYDNVSEEHAARALELGVAFPLTRNRKCGCLLDEQGRAVRVIEAREDPSSGRVIPARAERLTGHACAKGRE